MAIKTSLIFFLTLISITTAKAEIGEWFVGYGYKARFISGGLTEEGYYRGGVEVRLEEGWKTYWRVPGENGIPPVFSGENLTNLNSLEVFWPAPITFPDGDGVGIGYKNRVIFPFKINPQKIDQPINLVLSAFFGVCAEVCVPANEQFQALFLPTNQKRQSFPETLIDTAFNKVPVDMAETDLNVISAHFEEVNDNEYVTLSLDLGGTKTEHKSEYTILLEGPSDWFFAPKTVRFDTLPAGEQMKARVPLFRQSETTKPSNQALRVTILGNGKAVDHKTILK